jgi:hypothetical protein
MSLSEIVPALTWREFKWKLVPGEVAVLLLRMPGTDKYDGTGNSGPGRPRKGGEIEVLVVRMAEESRDWDYPGTVRNRARTGAEPEDDLERVPDAALGADCGRRFPHRGSGDPARSAAVHRAIHTRGGACSASWRQPQSTGRGGRVSSVYAFALSFVNLGLGGSRDGSTARAWNAASSHV